MARTGLVGIAVGVLAGVVAMLLTAYFAAGGHGTYVPAVALFPFAMLATLLTGHMITPAVIAFGFLQFPVYGAVTASTKTSNRTRVTVALGALHIIVAAIAFVFLRHGTFL